MGSPKRAAFEPLLMTDVDPVARDTFLENYPGGPPYLLGDVRDLDAKAVRRATDGREVAGLLGCLPCLGSSAAGKRNAADPQNQLLLNFFATARDLDVKFFVMANVPSVLDQELFRSQLARVRRRFNVWCCPLNTALHGLPPDQAALHRDRLPQGPRSVARRPPGHSPRLSPGVRPPPRARVAPARTTPTRSSGPTLGSAIGGRVLSPARCATA
jgi:hypothetical protein